MIDANKKEISPSMHSRPVAEIISIGDEIITGIILDTNSQYLSQSLSEVGVRVLYHSTIGDDTDAVTVAVAAALRRADVVIIIGGLGASQANLTRQTAANVLGLEFEFVSDSSEYMKNYYACQGRQAPDSNKVQAFFPKGSHIIQNSNGAALGFFIEASRSKLPNYTSCDFECPTRLDDFILFSFPSAPAELKAMWEGVDGREAVIRYSSRVTGGNKTVYRKKLIHAFGISKNIVETEFYHLLAGDCLPLVGVTSKNGVVTLQIFAEGGSEEECTRQIDELSSVIYSKIGEFVYGEDDDTLAGMLSISLRAQCRRVGVFEWGTRGTLTAALDSDILAFGRIFGDSEKDDFARLFGASAETQQEKQSESNVKETYNSSFYVLERSLSPELLQLFEMESRGQRVDYFLAIGPYSETAENETKGGNKIGVAFIDFRDPNAPILHRETSPFEGSPANQEILFSNLALDLLRRYQ